MNTISEMMKSSIVLNEIIEDKEVCKLAIKLAKKLNIKCKLYIGYYPMDIYGVVGLQVMYKIELSGTKWQLLRLYYGLTKGKDNRKLRHEKFNMVLDTH